MEEHLKKTYGFNKFREYQKDIISDLLNNENVFAILPTGGGKSLLYQFPATYRNKITIVVSPLISLMNDQCMYLNTKNISSVCLNSETCISSQEYKKYKIIYATPEFITQRIELFSSIENYIGLFAIDESHCVSQWSHDFRQSYLELGIIKKKFPSIPMLAVTATATPRVVDDIYELLNIEEVNEYTLGTRRDNLSIRVLPKSEFTKCTFEEPTIIYVQTRKICEELSNQLLCQGVSSTFYHGGMTKKDKEESHTKFTNGKVKVIVATISFGMGIDKSDIRHVINYGVANDIETYYQEIGRAGRDGMPCKATMYYNSGDFSTVQFLIKQSSSDSQIKIKMDAMYKLKRYLNETTICRQQMIEYYFEKGNLPSNTDLKHIPQCKICDNCTRSETDGMRDITDIAKIMVLAICEHYYKNNYSYGIIKTVDMIKKSAHPALYTLTKKKIKDIIEILISKDILRINTKDSMGWSGVVESTQKPIPRRINEVIIEHPILLKKDVLTKTNNTSVKSFDKLKRIRDKLAKKNLCLPTIYLNDRVLANIYEKKPRTLAELLETDGISQEFIFMYGEEFMAAAKSEFIHTPVQTSYKTKSKEEKIFNDFIKWRREKSIENSMPAYCIIHNNTIHNIILEKPNTLEKLSHIKGMGKNKLHMYGAEILGILKEQ